MSMPVQPAFNGVPPPPPPVGRAVSTPAAKIEQPPAREPELPVQSKHPKDRTHIPETRCQFTIL